MDKSSNSMGDAAPARSDTNAAIAGAMLALEGDLSDLRNMAEILAKLMDVHSDFVRCSTGYKFLKIPEADAQLITFAVFETERRATELQRAFQRACLAGVEGGERAVTA